jgi:hypothetical protein
MPLDPKNSLDFLLASHIPEVEQEELESGTAKKRYPQKTIPNERLLFQLAWPGYGLSPRDAHAGSLVPSVVGA